MSLIDIFNIAGSGMSAQSVRLNTTASNLANAQNVAGSPDAVYKPKHPVFQTFLDQFDREGSAGVRVTGIFESQAPARMQYAPDNPLADEKGYVFLPAVNVMAEMANMMSASRSFENNVKVINTVKQLLIRTIQMGQ